MASGGLLLPLRPALILSPQVIFLPLSDLDAFSALVLSPKGHGGLPPPSAIFQPKDC